MNFSSSLRSWPPATSCQFTLIAAFRNSLQLKKNSRNFQETSFTARWQQMKMNKTLKLLMRIKEAIVS